jgi:hypothetical protein
MHKDDDKNVQGSIPTPHMSLHEDDLAYYSAYQESPNSFIGTFTTLPSDAKTASIIIPFVFLSNQADFLRTVK